MSAPLDGLVVIDLSRILSGPYAATMLGDLGAKVIKVERPGDGDDSRHWGPPFVGPPGKRESTYFLSVNRNKESIALDLSNVEDRRTFEQLVRRADVVIENFRNGVLDRLGLSHERLSELNPGLVLLSISGFGHDGPDAARPAYDQILQGEGGLMSLTGSDGQPTRVGVPIADIVAGLLGVIGVLAALVERVRSGSGQRVSTSLLAAQIAVHTYHATAWLLAGEVPGPQGNHHRSVAPYGTFQASDGPFNIAVGNDSLWRRFASVIGLDPDDPGLARNEDRVKAAAELIQAIEARLRTKTVAFWMDALDAAGVPAGRIRSLNEVYASNQVRSQGLVMAVNHPELGVLELPGTPLRFSRSTLPTPAAPPVLDSASAEIRAWLDDQG